MNADIRRILSIVVACTLYSPVTIAAWQVPAASAEVDNSEVRQLAGEEMIAALELIAAHMRSNYESLQTWEAEFRFADKFGFKGTIPDAALQRQNGAAANELNVGTELSGVGYWEITRGKVRFAFDRERELLHVLYEPTEPVEFIDRRTAVQVTSDFPANVYHWIRAPEHFIEFGVDEMLGQVRGFPGVASVPDYGNRIAYRKVPREADHVGRLVDPRAFFMGGGQLVFDWCDSFVSVFRGNANPTVVDRVSKNTFLSQRGGKSGAEYVFLARSSPKNPKEATREIEIIFDSSVGFNPTSWSRSVGGLLTHRQRVVYQEQSGIFIPSEFEFERFDSSKPDADESQSSRRFVLESSTLNQPIASAKFTLDQLGFEYGDRMLDQIRNELFVYDGSEFVLADEFVLDPSKLRPEIAARIETSTTTSSAGEKPENPLLALLVVNGVVLLLVVSYVLWRRWGGLFFRQD